VIEAYRCFLENKLFASGADTKIRTAPFESGRGSKESLIAVYYEAGAKRTASHIDIPELDGMTVADYPIDITAVLNMGMVIASIPDEADLEFDYAYLVGFIRRQFKAICSSDINIPENAADLIGALRTLKLKLPDIGRIPVENLKNFYEKHLKLLRSA
jgi:hypothetical protein